MATRSEQPQMEDTYQSIFSSRYCRKSPLLQILSERNKAECWRQMWIWLAEAELELGLHRITQEQVEEMKQNKSNIDWAYVQAEESKIRHDVMAHNHAFGKVCPNAAGIIHLGATSCYVHDNGDLIIQRDCIDHLLRKMAACLNALANFAGKHKRLVTVGRTHWQTASMVTVGKRACIWAQELLMAFERLSDFRKSMRFRGIKGATGTQDSFLTLFNGDASKVAALDDLIMRKAQFNRRFIIAGQTYSRQQDCELLNVMGQFGAAVTKICTDIRFLQAQGELLEPFEADQIGSSAMPYKKNPMKSERCCGLARMLMEKPQIGMAILASQGLERTLDDSSTRRIAIPEAFLTADAILLVLQNVFLGLTVREHAIKRVVADELPFLALEKAMMLLTDEGVDRQAAHAKIRSVALEAADGRDKTGQAPDIDRMLADPFFDPVRQKVKSLTVEPLNFAGLCVEQVDEFLAQELRPAIKQLIGQGDAVLMNGDSALSV